MFSCRLGNEQETALSIIDPVNVQVELCGSPTYQSTSGLLDAFSVEDVPPLLEVRTDSCLHVQLWIGLTFTRIDHYSTTEMIHGWEGNE